MANYCEPCDRHFGSQASLAQHLNNASIHRTCDLCDWEFACYEDLQQYLRDAPAHRHDPAPAPPPQPMPQQYDYPKPSQGVYYTHGLQPQSTVASTNHFVTSSSRQSVSDNDSGYGGQQKEQKQQKQRGY